MADGLHLLAEDERDLAVISAALQDAVLKVDDIVWEPAAKQLTLQLRRYCWECAEPQGKRVLTGLQLGCVLRVRHRDLPKDVPDAALELLAMEFIPGESPGGRIQFHFAGGGDLLADVECVDAALADLSPAWAARRTPRHAVDA